MMDRKSIAKLTPLVLNEGGQDILLGQGDNDIILGDDIDDSTTYGDDILAGGDGNDRLWGAIYDYRHHSRYAYDYAGSESIWQEAA